MKRSAKPPENTASVTVDGAHYGARLLRPSRPTLGAARVLAREEEDLRALWERAAAQALIPSSWLEQAPMLDEDPEDLVRDAPPTTAHALVFASDASAIETVQTLARSLAHALAAWGVCDADAAPQWRLVARSAWRPAGLHPLLLLHARVAMPKASLFDGVRLSFLAASRDAASAREVADTLRFAALWRAAATLRDGSPTRSFASALCPFGFDDTSPERWPDPWTPLLEIVGLGYAVHAYERRRIVLVAPTL
ncbi:MAG: hypothetical protein JNK05_06260 [Myxococcales bacterium]|nr:hypothetical protein [Myxococcales bacterium]